MLKTLNVCKYNFATFCICKRRIANLTHRFVLPHADDNNLGGQLPCEIEDLNLEVVNIRSNEFRGNIDPYFCNKDYNYNSFWADCHQGGETIATTTGINEEEEEPYVECLCCTVCCNKETCCSDNGCWTLGHN